MKKRIFSIALALTMLLSLGGQALAEEAPKSASEPSPEYRLASVVYVSDGYPTTYTFTYGQGGYLPTEVTCPNDMSCPITAVYDEAGRLTALQDGYQTISNVYDEAGDLVRTEQTTDYGDGPTTVIAEYVYDEAGNRIRTEQTTDSGDSSATVVTEYTYDEDGSCVYTEQTADYGDSSNTVVTEYTYDENGNCVREEYTYNYGSDDALSNTVEYTYDSEGRKLNALITDTSGEGNAATYTYTYSEDGRSTTQTRDNGSVNVEYKTPLLDTSWQDTSVETVDGTSYTLKRFSLSLKANKDQDIFRTVFHFDSEPSLTYDGNGCLVRVESPDGKYAEFTWEPVA